MFLFASPFFCCEKCCVSKKMKLQFFPKTPRWGPDFLYLGPEDPRLFHMPNDTERILMLFTARTWGETQPGLGMGWSWKVPEIWSHQHSGDQQTWGVYLKDQGVFPARTNGWILVSFWSDKNRILKGARGINQLPQQTNHFFGDEKKWLKKIGKDV